MGESEASVIGGLVRGLLEDTRELIREEIALAKMEMRQELAAARQVGIAFGAAAVLGVLLIVMTCIALGGFIAWIADWPAWAGYAIVAGLLAGATLVFVQIGRRKLTGVRGLPKTVEATKENVAWIQNKTSGK